MGDKGGGRYPLSRHQLTSSAPLSSDRSRATTNHEARIPWLFRVISFWLQNSPFLLDIDECSSAQPCEINAFCNNTHGSYNCICEEGYYGDGLSCTGNKLTSSFPWQIHFSKFNLLSAFLQVLKWPGACFRAKRIWSLEHDIVSINSKNVVIVLRGHFFFLRPRWSHFEVLIAKIRLVYY